MIQESLVVDYGRRVLSREPSEGIARIARLRPEIYAGDSKNVCQAVTRNYAGALLLARDRDRYIEGFLSKGLSVPFEVDRPIHFLEGVPVSVFDRSARRYRNTGLVAERVMIKEVGIPTGLVVEGELAGLVLRNEIGINRQGMYAVRVLNDHGAGETGHPYLPTYTTPLDTLAKSVLDMVKLGSPRALEFWKIVEKQKREYQNAYSDEVEDGYRKKEDFKESDLIFKLLKRIGIPVNEKKFHMTRLGERENQYIEAGEFPDEGEIPNYEEAALFDDQAFGLVPDERF